MQIKLTRSAITMLLSHYRSVFKHAYIKSLASAAVVGLFTIPAAHAATETIDADTTVATKAVTADDTLTVNEDVTYRVSGAMTIVSSATNDPQVILTEAGSGSEGATVSVATLNLTGTSTPATTGTKITIAIGDGATFSVTGDAKFTGGGLVAVEGDLAINGELTLGYDATAGSRGAVEVLDGGVLIAKNGITMEGNSTTSTSTYTTPYLAMAGDSEIQGNVAVGGASFVEIGLASDSQDLEDTPVIDGDLTLSAINLTFTTSAGEELQEIYSNYGNVNVVADDAKVTGDVKISSGTLTVTNGGDSGGTATYQDTSKLTIGKNLTIAGEYSQVLVKGYQVTETDQETTETTDVDSTSLHVTGNMTLSDAGELDIDRGEVVVGGTAAVTNGLVVMGNNSEMTATGGLTLNGTSELILGYSTGSELSSNTFTGNIVISKDAAITGTDEDFTAFMLPKRGNLWFGAGANTLSGNLTVNGGLVTVDGVDLRPTAVDPLNGKATATITGDLTITGGAFQVNGHASGETYTTYGASSASTLSSAVGALLNVAGTTTLSGGTFTVNDQASAVTKNLVLSGGTLSVSKLAVGSNTIDSPANGTLYAKSLTITDGTDLDVTSGTTLTTSAANSVTISEASSLKAAASSMVASDYSATASGITAKSFNVDSTSTLTLTGLSGSLTTAQAKSIKALLFTDDSTGMISLPGVTFSGVEEQVTYTDAKDLSGFDALSGSEVTGVTGSVEGANSWGSATLASGGTALQVAADSAVILSTAKDGNFVNTSAGDTGSVTLGDGAALRLNGDGAVKDITGTDSYLTVGEDEAGTVAVNSVKGVKLDLNEDSSLVVADDAEIWGTAEGDLLVGDKLKLTGDLDILDATGTADTLSLNGNTLFLDPAFFSTENLTDGDVEDGNVLNGSIVVGSGSVFYLGDSALSEEEYAHILSSAGTSAAAYLDDELVIASGGQLIVDTALTDDNWDAASLTEPYSTENLLYVGADSALVLSANSTADGAAITFADEAGGTVVFEQGSVLKVEGLTTGTDSPVVVFSNVSSLTDNGVDIDLANVLYNGSLELNDDDEVVLGASYVGDESAAKALAYTDPSIASALMAYASAGGGFDGKGVANRALELGSLLADDERYKKVGQSLNSAARLVILGGAVQNGVVAQRAYTDALEERMGFGTRSGTHIGVLRGVDVSVWLAPTYGIYDSKGMKGGVDGNYGAKTKLWGLTIGSDVMLDNGVTAGLAFHGGSGKSDSKGDYAATKNDFKYFGLSVYGSYAFQGFKVLGDLTYTAVRNDIKQSNEAGKLTVKPDSKFFSLGLNAKYDIDVHRGIMVSPHLGLRYQHYNVKSASVHIDGGVDSSAKSVSGNLVTLPLGVSASYDWRTKGGWVIKPAADISLIPVMGDTSANSKLVSDGVTLDAKSDVVNKFMYRTKIGVEAQYRNFGVGLGYSYMGGKKLNNHNIGVNVRYTF